MISPSNSVERDQLRKDCLKHATRSNGLIDWEAYELGLYDHRIVEDLASHNVSSSNSSGSDNACVFFNATPGTDHKKELYQEICPCTPSSFASKRGEGSCF